MIKRHVKYRAADNNNKTPKESMPRSENVTQYEGDGPPERAHRNSKKGLQNSSKLL